MGSHITHTGSFTDRHLAYARCILNGEIPACKWTKAAVRRQLDDIEKYSSNKSLYYFDPRAVEHVCSFVEHLRHVKGRWARRGEYLQLSDFQVFMLACVFGWKRRDNDTRRFRIAYTEAGRKNGKSVLMAAIALYLLVADSEIGAEVYSLATTHDQAAIVATLARQMSRKDVDFQTYFGVKVMAHCLWLDETNSVMRALSADGSVLDGLNVHGGIIDELHAHKTRAVWDVIETATGARSQPLVWAITTAGTDRAGICYEQRSYVCRVLNATLHKHDGLGYRVEGDYVEDDSYYGIIYTIDDDDDWTSESAWIKANPNLGVSITIEDMRQQAKKAQALASAVPAFLTKRLSVWVNADAAWMDMRIWDRQADTAMHPDEFRDWECYIGLDLASKIDITAMVLLFKRFDQYVLFGYYFLPGDTIEESSNSQYAGWAASNNLISTSGNCVDYTVIEDRLKNFVSKYNVKEIAYDPGFAWDFNQRMFAAGLPMVEVRPSIMNYSEPMKEFEAAILSGRLRHDGNPVATWMVSNVVCHRDAKDNIYPRKEREENKIDGVVAAVAAMSRALADTEGASVYEQRGIITI